MSLPLQDSLTMSSKCSREKLILFYCILCALATIMDSAQNTCHIGNDGERQVARSNDDNSYLYLDVDHPASCAGIITSWTLCYYSPLPTDTEESTGRSKRSASTPKHQTKSMSGSRGKHWATFAVYRKTDDGYTRVSGSFSQSTRSMYSITFALLKIANHACCITS